MFVNDRIKAHKKEKEYEYNWKHRKQNDKGIGCRIIAKGLSQKYLLYHSPHGHYYYAQEEHQHKGISEELPFFINC
jgi:hypothetical protein